MYQGANEKGEFIEFTNTGTTAVDMTGWSFDDDSRLAGSVSLSAFGIVNAGESVISTESTVAAFRANWGLSSEVTIIGGNTVNLGRADEINLFDNTGTLAGSPDLRRPVGLRPPHPAEEREPACGRRSRQQHGDPVGAVGGRRCRRLVCERDR